MSDYTDIVVKAMAADAQIRAFACSTRQIAETARKAHNTSPVVTAALGRLLAAGTMMGSMLKGEKDLLTLRIKSDGDIRGLTVTADSHGNVKGYADVPDVIIGANAQGKLNVSGAVGSGTLQVIRDMGLKEPYIGQTELQTGEIAEDLTYYFAISEQTPSSVGLGVLMEKNNTVKQAGGFIVQLMPFASEEVIGRLEKNLASVTSVTALLDEGRTPEELLGILLDGLDMEITGIVPVRFHCGCDKERVEKALISIGRKDIQEMIDEGRDIEMNCQFCNQNYSFSVDELKNLCEKC